MARYAIKQFAFVELRKLKKHGGPANLEAIITAFGIRKAASIFDYYPKWSLLKLFRRMSAGTIERRLQQAGFGTRRGNIEVGSDAEGLNLIQRAVRAEHPLILLIRADHGVPHWVTVLGYDDVSDDIYVYDSSEKIPTEDVLVGNRKIPWSILWTMWKGEIQGNLLWGPHFYIEVYP